MLLNWAELIRNSFELGRFADFEKATLRAAAFGSFPNEKAGLSQASGMLVRWTVAERPGLSASVDV